MKRFISLLLSLLLLFSLAMPALAAQEDGDAAESSVEGATLRNLGIPTLSYFPDTSDRIYSRTVWGMEVYDGRIYIGCGDYDRNSGSWRGGLPILSYDATTDQWNKEYTASDEQISRFFLSNGGLYIPSMDPTGNYGTGSIYYLENGKWNTRSNVPRGVHVFDLLFRDGGQTVFAGLGLDSGVGPVVAISENGGARYRVVKFHRNGEFIQGKDITQSSAYPSAYARTYNLFEYHGQVYATLYVYSSGEEARAKCNGLYRYDADENVFEYYSDAPYDLMRSSMSSSVDLIYKDKFILTYNNIYIFSDDLTSYTVLSRNQFQGIVTWARVIGDDLYFTTYESLGNKRFRSHLYKTSDLENIEEVANLTAGAYVRSFCYYDGVFYLGTESDRYDATTETGTVYALKPQKSDCTHTNIAHTVTLATEAHEGLSSYHCVDCSQAFSSLNFPFTDLADAWYLDNIAQAYNRNLMSGTSPTTFAPDMTTRRAMLVQVLYNLEGKPATDALANPFADVNEDNYFYDAVKWAYANGIVTGKSDTSFAPEDDLTREQFATILYRYAQYKGADVSGAGDLSSFTDTSKVGAWALDAITWANGQGIITGIGNTIAPQGSATRAQMATMMIRYLQ